MFGTGLAVAAVVLLGVGIRGELHDRGETSGRVTVSGCVFETYAQHGNIYRCDGAFTADGGAFTIPDVTWSNTGRADDGSTVRALVSGPGDTNAELVRESWWRRVLTFGGAIALVGVLVAFIRGQRRLPRR